MFGHQSRLKEANTVCPMPNRVGFLSYHYPSTRRLRGPVKTKNKYCTNNNKLSVFRQTFISRYDTRLRIPTYEVSRKYKIKW